jgi:hypothetical protein
MPASIAHMLPPLLPRTSTIHPLSAVLSAALIASCIAMAYRCFSSTLPLIAPTFT